MHVLSIAIQEKHKQLKLKRREEEILEDDKQNVTASVERAARFGGTSSEARPVREKLKDYFVSIIGRQEQHQ